MIVNAAEIRRRMFERGLGVCEFAKSAKLHYLTATRTLTDGANVTPQTVAKLTKFFACNGNELIMKGGTVNG